MECDDVCLFGLLAYLREWPQIITKTGASTQLFTLSIHLNHLSSLSFALSHRDCHTQTTVTHDWWPKRVFCSHGSPVNTPLPLPVLLPVFSQPLMGRGSQALDILEEWLWQSRPCWTRRSDRGEHICNFPILPHWESSRTAHTLIKNDDKEMLIKGVGAHPTI